MILPLFTCLFIDCIFGLQWTSEHFYFPNQFCFNKWATFPKRKMLSVKSTHHTQPWHWFPEAYSEPDTFQNRVLSAAALSFQPPIVALQCPRRSLGLICLCQWRFSRASSSRLLCLPALWTRPVFKKREPMLWNVFYLRGLCNFSLETSICKEKCRLSTVYIN